MHQVALGHGHEDVQVALDHRVLGHDGARMAALVEQRQCRAGQPPLLFDRLVGIGVAADVDRLAHVAALREVTTQHLFEVGLGEQLGLEIEAGREVEVAMGGPGVAMDAAALYDDLKSVHFRRVYVGQNCRVQH